MDKRYTVKVYTIGGTLKKTLSGQEVIEGFEFTSQINGGQWEGKLIMNKSFGATDISTGDVAKITVFTDTYPNGRLIYTGYITRLNRKYSTSKNVIEYQMIGISSIMNFIYFNQGASYSFNKNQDPAQTIKDVIDYFNTQYTAGWFSYAGGHIANFGSNISLDFYYRKCLNSIQGATSPTTYWWRIGADGEFWFQPTPWTPTHMLTAGKDVDSVELSESSEEIVNRHFLTWKSGTTSAANDAPSQSVYGIRELRGSDSSIENVGSANTASASFIAANKDVKKITSITVNNKYNIEDIFPGDTIKVHDLGYTVSDLQILKVTYNPESVDLELGVLESIGNAVFNP